MKPARGDQPAAARRCARRRRHRSMGFTLVEVLVVVAIIAVTAAVVLPRLTDDAPLRLRGAAGILISDIEYAQVLNISFPNDPVIVRFDAANSRYWLAYADTPDTALVRDGTGDPYDVTFGEGRAGSVGDVGITLENLADSTIAFDASGGLVDFNTTPRVTLSAGDLTLSLVISPMTGSVSEMDE